MIDQHLLLTYMKIYVQREFLSECDANLKIRSEIAGTAIVLHIDGSILNDE